MKIGEEWFVNYIKKFGAKIIIPKEAKFISGIGAAVERFGELLKDGIEIVFEEGSQIEEIEMYTFLGCKVKNNVVIPRNIKKINYRAFLGCTNSFTLEKDSELVECNDPTVLFNGNIIDVPPKLKILNLGEEDFKAGNSNTISIPEQSETKRIIVNNNSIKNIKTANGDIALANDESIQMLDIDENLYHVICQKQTETKETKKNLVVFDKKTLKEIYRGRLLATEYFYKGKAAYVVEEDDIWKCDLEKTNSLPFDIYIHLKSDENSGDRDKDTEHLYTRKGKIYTRDEIKEIQEKLQLIVSKINVPPEGIKDREKIIYAQIVKQVSGCLEYDYDFVNGDLKRYDDIKYFNAQKHKYADETQNLKGLLKEKTVCMGFATIVQALCTYYNINCKVLVSEEHAWNLVNLDGENYEDDLTWYQNDLQTSNVLGIDMFLRGKDKSGKREFGRIKYHENNDIDVELSDSLEKNKRFHLLTTDWSSIKDWDNVDIDKDIGISDYMGQIRVLAKCKESMCLLANKRIFSKERINLKTFCSKIKEFFRGRGNKDDER